MSRLQLIAEKRVASSKGAARALRREGRIPAVLYGEGEPKCVSVGSRDWNQFRSLSGNTIITLNVGSDEHQALVKDTQEDIVTGKVNHIDVYAVHAGVKLHTMVPVRLEGSPVGVREGGILEQKIEEIEVVCLPRDIPSRFVIDVSALNVGDSLHVGNLDVPEGVELRADAEETLVIISHATKFEAEEEGTGEEDQDALAADESSRVE